MRTTFARVAESGLTYGLPAGPDYRSPRYNNKQVVVKLNPIGSTASEDKKVTEGTSPLLAGFGDRIAGFPRGFSVIES